MSAILISDIESETHDRLCVRAREHGRTPEAEAKAILEESLRAPTAPIWDEVNAFRNRLAASGQVFSDSAELIREDRER